MGWNERQMIALKVSVQLYIPYFRHLSYPFNKNKALLPFF